MQDSLFNGVHGHHNLIFPFWGVTGWFPGWFPERDFYLVSAASLWWSSRGRFVFRSYPDSRVRMFLDCGGFSFFSKSGDYPFSPDDYLSLVRRYDPLIWASMDYPCEPGVVRSGWSSNYDRMEATLDYLAYFSRVSDHPGLLPVIQGFTLEQRLYCLERILSTGLDRPLMAIGSLCACRSVAEIDNIIYALGRAWGRGKFHLFGVKVSYFQESLCLGRPYIFSFDTAAWRFGLRGRSKFAPSFEDRRRFFEYRGYCLSLLG